MNAPGIPRPWQLWARPAAPPLAPPRRAWHGWDSWGFTINHGDSNHGWQIIHGWQIPIKNGHLKIRRPLPSPRRGRRLGPPQVWNLFRFWPSNASNRLRQLRPGTQATAIWVCHSHLLLLRRSSLPFASPQMLKILRGSFDQALWPQAFVVRALKPAVCLHGPLFLGRSSLPFASPQMLKILRGSFDQALWACRLPSWPSVLRAFKPAVCQPSNAPNPRLPPVQACRLPALKCLKSSAAASTRHSGHRPLLLEPWACRLPPWPSVLRAFKPAVCQPSNAQNPPRQLRPGTLTTGMCC